MPDSDLQEIRYSEVESGANYSSEQTQALRPQR